MKLTKQKITLTAKQDTVLPGYLGSMLRGAFGEALMQYDKDLFEKFFNNKVDKNAPVYKYTNETPPAPFIFNPLKNYDFVRKNQEISFTLSLLGDYRHYQASIPEILQIMCENKMHKQKLVTEIKNIETITNPINENNIFDFNDFKKLSCKKTTLTLNLKTPLAVLYDNKLTANFSFDKIFGYIYRRHYLLDQIYGTGKISEELTENTETKKISLVDIQLSKKTIYRSSSVSGKYPMSGWTGKIKYAGDFSQVYPYLKFGEHLHAGSNTVFGFGKYTVK